MSLPLLEFDCSLCCKQYSTRNSNRQGDAVGVTYNYPINTPFHLTDFLIHVAYAGPKSSERAADFRTVHMYRIYRALREICKCEVYVVLTDSHRETWKYVGRHRL